MKFEANYEKRYGLMSENTYRAYLCMLILCPVLLCMGVLHMQIHN